MVTAILNKGGGLHSWSLLAIPEKAEDLENLLTEPNHIDINENDRKEFREKHQSELKTLKRQRSKNRKKDDEPVETDDAKMKAKEFEAKMRLLWLPPPSCIKDFCARKTAGFISQGMYSNSEARGAGIGFITEPAFRALLHTKSWNKNGEILVRNIQNLNYKVAKLKILCPS